MLNPEPKIKKFPTEIFGHSYVDHSTKAKKALADQYCCYLNSECKKPRKNEPEIKVGVCSVGYKGSFSDQYIPVIICPHRLREKVVFEEVQKIFLSHWGTEIEWASEVGIGVGGSVDYVAVRRSSTSNQITDFLCVEFQAAGTTGSPWPAVLEFKKDRQFKKDSYNFGINWANEFIKTMMQQVYKKGKIIDHWKRHIVFVVQDIAIEYIKSAVDSVDLHEKPRAGDNIHFLTFALKWDGSSWKLKPSGVFSTNLDGIINY